jgi:hypothetical protein
MRAIIFKSHVLGMHEIAHNGFCPSVCIHNLLSNSESTYVLNYISYSYTLKVVRRRFDSVSHRIALILTLHETQMKAYQEYYHLGCKAMKSGRSSPTFKRNIYSVLKTA